MNRVLFIVLLCLIGLNAKSQIFGVEVGDTVSIHTEHLSFLKKIEGVKLKVEADLKNDVVNKYDVFPESNFTSEKYLDKILDLTRKYYHLDRKHERVKIFYKEGCLHKVIEYKKKKLRIVIDLLDDYEWKLQVS